MLESLKEKKNDNVFVVQFANWRVEVPIDDHNLDFDLETQMYEAGARAVEVFKGYNKYDLNIVTTDNSDEELKLGGACLVYLKDTDATEGSLLFTGILLADGGYYKDSWSVIQATDQHLKNLADGDISPEFKSDKIKKQLDNFEELTSGKKKPVDKKSNKKTNTNNKSLNKVPKKRKKKDK